ncbi:hypothetical protein F5X98DRAFT_385119 [Xylaria grammica]|nr:hypothetical protein F5X98DRAFT_385119 [Xylaria grammica]
MTEPTTSPGYGLGHNHEFLNPGDPNGNWYPGWGRAPQPPSQHSQQVGSQGTGMTFACHFYRHNEEENLECLNRTLNRVCDVRLHLNRRHTQPSYCPRCGVTFPRDEFYSQRDEHLRSCISNENPPPPPGMTPEQLRDMNKHRRRGSNDEERWLKIWDIMFPGQMRPLPESVYVDNAAERRKHEIAIGLAQYEQGGGVEQFSHHYMNGFNIEYSLPYLPEDVSPAHHPVSHVDQSVWHVDQSVTLTDYPSLNGENYDNDVHDDGPDHLDNNQD